MRRANKTPGTGTQKPRNLIPVTMPLAWHKHNPSGSKLLRRFFKEKHGRRGTAIEARDWYANWEPSK